MEHFKEWLKNLHGLEITQGFLFRKFEGKIKLDSKLLLGYQLKYLTEMGITDIPSFTVNSIDKGLQDKLIEWVNQKIREVEKK